MSNSIVRLATLSACAVLSGTAPVAGTDEDTILSAEEGLASDQFGSSISADDNRVIVGARSSNADCESCGRAFIFERSADGWTETTTLSPASPPPFEYGYFGWSVGLAGTCAIVGAPLDDDCTFPDIGCNTGAVYVYELIDGSWIQQTRLLHFDSPDPEALAYELGTAIAIDGDFIAAGASQADEERGAVYVYRHNGSSWTNDVRLAITPDPGDIELGEAVAVDGTTIIAGAPSEDIDGLSRAGAVYIWRLIGGVWTFEARIPAPDLEANAKFGSAVDLQGDQLIVGGLFTSSKHAGKAYVFQRSGSTWTHEQTLTPHDGMEGDRFGSSVAIYDDLIAIGAERHDGTVPGSGAVYTYRKTSDTWVWEDELTPSLLDIDARLGTSLAMDERHIVAGATGATGADADTGAAFVYDINVDSDGDGLYDDWEINGIPFVAANGDIRRYVLDRDGDGTSDADPNFKDLFIEIDAMVGRNPSASTPPAEVLAAGLATNTILDDVVQSFLSSPVTGNPNGMTGVSLQLQMSDLNVPQMQWQNSPWGDFFAVKSSSFGSAAERADPDAGALLAAKARAYRYCIFADRRVGNTISGQGELPGNDFMVTLGGWSTPGGTPSQQAGTFMHELGHTLNLRHGGGDDTHFKPNYYSVMNYLWQIPEAPWAAWWRLDYSREAFPTLNEAALDENTGIGATDPAYALALTPHTYLNGSGQLKAKLVPMSGGNGVDWNNDGTNESSVAVDINRLDFGSTPTPDEVLPGHDDWSNILLNFRDSAYYADGVMDTHEDEILMTAELSAYLDAIELDGDACPADLTGDSNVDVNDLLAILGSWGTPDGDIDGDGTTDVNDLLALLAAWGPCP